MPVAAAPEKVLTSDMSNVKTQPSSTVQNNVIPPLKFVFSFQNP